ncbi:glycosyltransferase [Chloroflexia bacterium SDU3-3]|nr:glycosyltransferase [Chloroflexia bacterium SDU3-3]
MQWLFGLLGLGAALAAVAAQDAARMRATPQLPQAASAAGGRISVLIPARDEAGRIGACLGGLAHQRLRACEVIVVDDASTDGTADVARAHAAALPELRVLAGQPLPPGWAGKCWACWQAAQAARGEWLLFLDADVVPAPGLLADALTHAQRADALTLMPRQTLVTLAERLLVPAFHTILYSLYPLAAVGDASSPLALFNGQAILIRREVYQATGGHRSVRASVLEDADYAAVVKGAGYRIRAAEAFGQLSARMYTGWPDALEGLGKNAVAGARSGGPRSAWVGLRQGLLAFGPWWAMAAALAAGPPLAAAGALALAALAAAHVGWLYHRRYGLAPWWGLAYPLGLGIYYAVALRGLLRVRGGRGVRWKGRVLDGR